MLKGMRGSVPPGADSRPGQSAHHPNHLEYFQLRDALEAPGCPVCRLAEEAVEASQRTLLHENVNDPGVRERLVRSGGFCREHAWRLTRHRDLLGTAIIHRDLMARFRAGLDAHQPELARCPACVEQGEVARMAVSVLTRRFEDPEIRRRFEASDGLCREHFYQARAAWSGAPHALEMVQTACLSHLMAQLDELIRKQDYRFSQEPIRGEGNSWLRAIAAVSGLDAEALPRPRSRHLPIVKDGSTWESPAAADDDGDS